VIEEIVPSSVATAEDRADDDGKLFAEERALVSRAVEKRRREFAGGRNCARRALGQLGFAPGPILSGARGEPLWPAGSVGSITHCDGYRACAVARREELASIGIDAESHAPLPHGLLPDIARSEEQPLLVELARSKPAIHWDRLLFSAKESVYKAWFPLAEAWLGFEDATLSIDPGAGTFAARLLVPGPVLNGRAIETFRGRWLVRDGIVVTAIAIPA
jgi:4'-phosphopantetheinyl transferase EntD